MRTALYQFPFRYEMDNPEFVLLTNIIQEATDIAGNGLAGDYLPFLKYIPTSATRKVFRLAQSFHGVVEKHLIDHRESYSPGIIFLLHFSGIHWQIMLSCVLWLIESFRSSVSE